MPLKVVYSTASPASALVSPEIASFDVSVPPFPVPGGAAIDAEKMAASAHASNAGLILEVDHRWLD